MSYHGTHVVVIEIPEGSWRAGGQTIDTEKIGDTSRNGNLCTLRHAEAVSGYSAGSEASSPTLA